MKKTLGNEILAAWRSVPKDARMRLLARLDGLREEVEDQSIEEPKKKSLKNDAGAWDTLVDVLEKLEAAS